MTFNKRQKLRAWQRKTCVIVMVGLIGVLGNRISPQTQGALPPTFYSGHHIGQLRWSTDSGMLTFFDGGYTAVTITSPEIGKWVSYNTRTNLFVPATVWPLKPSLSSTQQTALGIDLQQFASLSPNGRYVVYPGMQSTTSEVPARSVTIGDLQTGQSYATSATLLEPNYSPDAFDVIWSQSGNAFILNTQRLAGAPLHEFVSGYTTTLTNAIVQPITNINIAGQPFSAENPFDVSADGSRLLIGGSNSDDQRLAIWSPSNPAQSRAISFPNMGQVFGAHFIPSDENQILIFMNTGLVKYNVSSQQVTNLGLINNDIEVAKAVFSPDGNWLAILEADTVLYLIDIQHSPNNVLPPPPTLTPTTFVPPLKLQLIALCSPDPNQYRSWKIINPNPFDVTFFWHLVDTDEQGSGVAPGAVNNVPGEITFNTVTQLDKNTLALMTTVEDQDTQDSISAPCVNTPTFTPTRTPSPTNSPTVTATRTYTLTPTSVFTSTRTPTALPLGALKLQYYPDPTALGNTTDGLMPDFNIVNTGSTAVPLSELKIRYYFTRETTDPNVTFRWLCSYTVLSGGCGSSSVVRGTVVKMTTPVTGADSYLELSFTGGTLAANSQTDEILSYVNKSDFSNYTQNNDYSFDGTRTTETFTDWNKVTLYRNGVLVWGVEPQ